MDAPADIVEKFLTLGIDVFVFNIKAIRNKNQLPMNRITLINSNYPSENNSIRRKCSILRMKENEDYFIINNYNKKDFMSEIFPVLYAKAYNEVYAPRIQFTMTSRCNLHCKDCCNGCNNWNNTDKSNDRKCEELKETIDILFSKIKYVNHIKILGGEPFLCEENLLFLLTYLKTNYRNCYYKVTIDTNGTVMPSEKMLKKLKEDNVILCISDYRHNVKNIENIYGKLLSVLLKEGIKHLSYHQIERWYDYQLFKKKCSSSDLEEKTKKCFHSYPYLISPEIYLSKIYICSIGYNTMRSLKKDTSNVCCLNLETIANKIEIVQHLMALDTKWSFEPCNYCNGSVQKIEAAIQEG